MKSQITALILILLTQYSCTNTKKSILISGKVVNPIESSEVYLKQKDWIENKFKPIDTAFIDTNGEFFFDKEGLSPNYYQIAYKDSTNKKSVLMVYDKPSKDIRIIIDTLTFISSGYSFKTREIIINGSDDTNKMEGYFDISTKYYKDSIKPTKDLLNKLLSEDKQDNTLIDSLNSKLKDFNSLRIKSLNEYILDEMGTSPSIFQTVNLWDETNEVFMDTILSRFRNNDQNSFILPYLEAEINKLKRKNIIGSKASNFRLKTLDGSEYELNKLLGKNVILIDFWASWCSPCIKEIPSIQKTYDMYKNSGFEVISISTDRKPENWKKISETIEFKWFNLIDDEKSNVAKQYKVSELPTNFLIDLDGNIIKKNISQESLRNYLKAYFEK